MAHINVIVLLPYFFGMGFADVDRPVPVSEVHVLVGHRVELPCDVSRPQNQYDVSMEVSETLGPHSGFSRTVRPGSNVGLDDLRWWPRRMQDTRKRTVPITLGDDQDPYRDYDEEDDQEGETRGEPRDVVGSVAAEEDQDGGFLVLWFFDPDRKPIYSLDVRGRRLTSGRHWWDEGRLGRRAFFLLATAPSTMSPAGNEPNQFIEENETGKPSRLQILNVTTLDAGTYRCRVDYQDAPTRNVKYKVTVIEPPQKVMIVNANLQEISSVAGPLEEGADLVLTCRALGGYPTPSVTWWHGGNVIDNTTESRSEEMVTNRLVFPSVTRQYLHAAFTCQVSSSPYVAPTVSFVTLDLLLRPLLVEILSPSNQVTSNMVHPHQRSSSLVTEINQELRCRAVGSRPAASITWWRENRQIKTAKTMYVDDGNVTLSILTFVPTSDDDGRHMTCRAENPQLSDSALEDSWKLDVQYAPSIRLTMGTKINPDDIKEGDDMYFECHIRANPPIYRLTWMHNGLPLWHNASAGVVLSNVSLVLQAVSRQRAGQYTCAAANTRGEATSPPLHLRVQYIPHCQTDTQRPIGTTRQESSAVHCRMDADPSAQLQYSWTFIAYASGVAPSHKDLNSLLKAGSSGDAMFLPRTQFHSEGPASTLTYIPQSEAEYGLLACWASNSVGTTRDPCIFQVIPAGKPVAPQNCTMNNRSAESIRVDCVEGFDGGLQQTFGLDVLDPGSRTVKISLTSPHPWFWIEGLEPDSAFLLHIYALNAKGRSEEVTVEGFTLRAAEKHTVSASTGLISTFQMTYLLAIIIGTAATLLLVAIVLALIIQRKYKQKQALRLQDTQSTRHGKYLENQSPERHPDSDGMKEIAGHGVRNMTVHFQEPDILLGDLTSNSSSGTLPKSKGHERSLKIPHVGRPPDTSPDEDGWGMANQITPFCSLRRQADKTMAQHKPSNLVSSTQILSKTLPESFL